MKMATVWMNGNGAPARRAAWLTLATAAAMTATALWTGVAGAGSPDGAGYRAAQRELVRDRRDRRQDWGDVRQLQRLVSDLEDAQHARAWREDQFTRRQIHQVIRRELKNERKRWSAGTEEVW